MWLNISERTFYVLLWETPLYTFYSLERLKEEGAQYSGATVYNSWVQHVTLQRGRFVHRAVIWCVNMASINPEGARVIKSCIVVLQGRILPLTLVWLDINMAFRRESPSFQKKKKKPGRTVQHLLPSDGGHMAGSGVATAMYGQPAKTSVWCQGYGCVEGGKCTHYTQTPFLASCVRSLSLAFLNLDLSFFPKGVLVALSLLPSYTHLPRV